MIQKITYKISAMLLAILVLLSSFSFAITKHYCCNELVDVAVFSEVQQCDSEFSDLALDLVTKKTCCKSVVELIEGQDVFKISSFDFELNSFYLPSFFNYDLSIIEGYLKFRIPFSEYSPPLLISDIHVLNEVFLI